MDEFYVTALSDSSIHLYPENSHASFRNDLAHPVNLQRDKWVVGLAELSYAYGYESIGEDVLNETGELTKNVVLTRAGRIVFDKTDFKSFKELYTSLKNQIKGEELQELLLSELQSYLLSHQREIRELESAKKNWVPMHSVSEDHKQGLTEFI